MRGFSFASRLANRLRVFYPVDEGRGSLPASCPIENRHRPGSDPGGYKGPGVMECHQRTEQLDPIRSIDTRDKRHIRSHCIHRPVCLHEYF
jgi:hypothetical protein